MPAAIKIQKGRTKILTVNLGFDVSTDTFASEIRAKKEHSAPVLATWNVSFDTDGTDGRLILRLDDSETISLVNTSGYMDIKRTSAGEPYSAFAEPLLVEFEERITA